MLEAERGRRRGVELCWHLRAEHLGQGLGLGFEKIRILCGEFRQRAQDLAQVLMHGLFGRGRIPILDGIDDHRVLRDDGWRGVACFTSRYRTRSIWGFTSSIMLPCGGATGRLGQKAMELLVEGHEIVRWTWRAGRGAAGSGWHSVRPA